MKRLIYLVLTVLMTFTVSTASAEEGFMRNTSNIPEELARIPAAYRQPAEHAGTLEKLTYET